MNCSSLRQSGAAVLFGPMRGHPAVLAQGCVPVVCGPSDVGILGLTVKLPGTLLNLARIGKASIALRETRLDKLPNFGSEGCLLGGILPIHRSLSSRLPGGRTALLRHYSSTREA